MPGFASNNYLGNQPVNDFWVPSTEQKHALGETLEGYNPAFGYGEFVYGKAAAAQEVGSLVQPTDIAWTMTDIPNTANTGFPVFVAMASMAINTFGWYLREGIAPVSTAASVAAGVAVGVGGAGQAGTNAAGKQLLGVRVLQPSTYAPTKVGQTTNGLRRVRVPDINGLFVGLLVSGTGVPGGASVAAIDPSGNEFTLSADATATGSATLTFTHTGWLICSLKGAHVQGAIT